MRIALFSAVKPETNRYIGLLRDGLIATGVEVTLLHQPGPTGLPPEAREADLIHLHWLELWGRPPYLNLAGLTRWGWPGRGLQRLFLPLVNSQRAFAWRRGAFLERFLSALTTYKTGSGRLVYTLHNLTQHEGEADHIEAHALSRLLSLADAVHVHNDRMADVLRARYPVIPPSVTIPHGNYLGAYPNRLDRAEARTRLDIPPDRFVALFLGLIRPYKGLDDLLAAFQAIDDPASLLLVAGQSRPPGYAESLIKAAKSDERIRWHPHFVPDDDLQVWMNAADIVVLPYRRVSTSGAAMLAFSFGKPIIAPALPAFQELMRGNPALGLLYDPTRPAALQAVLRQAQSINWQAARGDILAWAAQFDWQTIGQRLLTLYTQILDSPINN